MKSIVKYDKNIQEAFKFKTKSEPWMHFVISVTDADGGTKQVLAAVYVWDSRQVLESYRNKVLESALSKQLACLKDAAKPADNHEPLVGKDAAAINSEIRWKQA